MSTVYTAARPLPWCDRCQQHQVLTAGALCPVCADDDRRPVPLPLHRTEAGYPRCATCDGGGCPDCTDPA